jgi:hypothetical protein
MNIATTSVELPDLGDQVKNLNEQLSVEFKYYPPSVQLKKEVPTTLEWRSGEDMASLVVMLKSDYHIGSFTSRTEFVSKYFTLVKKIHDAFFGYYVGFDMTVDAFDVRRHIMDPTHYALKFEDIPKMVQSTTSTNISRFLSTDGVRSVIKKGFGVSEVNHPLSGILNRISRSFRQPFFWFDYGLFQLAHSEAAGLIETDPTSVRVWLRQISDSRIDQEIPDSDERIGVTWFPFQGGYGAFDSYMDNIPQFRRYMFNIFEDVVKKTTSIQSLSVSTTFSNLLSLLSVRVGTFDSSNAIPTQIVSGRGVLAMRTITAVALASRWYEIDYDFGGIEKGDILGIFECLIMPLLAPRNVWSIQSIRRCMNYIYNNLILQIRGVRDVILNVVNRRQNFLPVKNSDTSSPSPLLRLIDVILQSRARQELKTWLGFVRDYFISFIDGSKFGEEIFEGGGISTPSIQQRRIAEPTKFHRNPQALFVSWSNISDDFDPYPQKFIEFQRVVSGFSNNISIAGSNFQYKTKSAGPSLNALLREVEANLDNLQDMHSNFMRELQKAALFPLTAMDTGMQGHRSPIPKELITLRSADIGSAIITIDWGDAEVLINDYEYIGYGWSIAMSCEEIARSIRNSRLLIDHVKIFVPEYERTVQKEELFNLGISMIRWSTPVTTNILSVLKSTKMWTGIRKFSFLDRLSSPFSSGVKRASLFLKFIVSNINSYTEAFGFTNYSVYKPEFTRLMSLTEDPNIFMFEHSTVADYGLVGDVINDLTEYVDEPVTQGQIRIIKYQTVVDAAHANVAQVLFRPGSAFEIPCSISVLDPSSLSDVRPDDILSMILKGVGPNLEVAWEWAARTLLRSPMSFQQPREASPLQFPFRVIFFNNIDYRAIRDKLGQAKKVKSDFDTVFISKERSLFIDEDYSMDGSAMFRDLFQISEFTVPEEAILVGLPKTLFRR